MIGDDSLLTQASDVIGRAVVTLAGEDVAQVRDVLFGSAGDVSGFTLAGRGIFSGRMKEWLPWAGVHGFGPDAIMIAGEDRLTREGRADVQGDVTSNEVMTRSGKVVGEVVDAILRLEGDRLDVVGYEIEPSEGGPHGLIPLPDTLSVNEGRLVVPDAALEFLTQDLSGFAAAVDSFRARLEKDNS